MLPLLLTHEAQQLVLLDFPHHYVPQIDDVARRLYVDHPTVRLFGLILRILLAWHRVLHYGLQVLLGFPQYPLVGFLIALLFALIALAVALLLEGLLSTEHLMFRFQLLRGLFLHLLTVLSSKRTQSPFRVALLVVLTALQFHEGYLPHDSSDLVFDSIYVALDFCGLCILILQPLLR